MHGIGLNYSPCTERCDVVARYSRKEEHIRKPVIHFSRVYNYKSVNMQDGTIGVKELVENGFDLKVWDTENMYEYLLEQGPNERLKHELQQAYEKIRVALSKRDEETHKLIDDARKNARKEVLHVNDVQRRAHLLKTTSTNR